MNNFNPKKIILMLYHVIVTTIIASNLPLDTWLMGWDGLYPELNIGLNLIRGLSAGWQEYYGAGLVGGHGFAATLPHTIIIGFLSTLLPQHLLRSVFIMLCYYLGGLGMLLVSKKFLHIIFHRSRQGNEISHESEKSHLHQDAVGWYVSFVASLYYLLNLGTIQTFYVPLESFTVHFAGYPWLTYFALLLLDQVSLKRIGLFCLALFVSSIQGFIPAVFIAYAISLGLITGSYIWSQHFQKRAIRTVFVIWTCVIAVNAYWLGPVAYFTLTSSDDYINAYNNLLSTPEFMAKSIKYGGLSDVSQLHGLLWQSNELGGAIMQPWISHSGNPLIGLIGYAFFGCALAGLLLSMRSKRHPLAAGFALSFLYFFASIAIDTPPFSWLTSFIQSHSPGLAQAFRTTFTKFSIGMAFHYSFYISVGLYGIIRIAKTKFRQIPYHALTVLAGCAIILYGLPVWKGNLIYKKLYTSLPPQYLELTGYMNTLPLERVADFPQDCAEGWYNQLWGYFGSGFLWYGVKHPIMARSFDVWNHTNENYYWELSNALRANNYEAVDSVFSKYDIRYILYDQNITHCRSQKGFQSSRDLLDYLKTSDAFVLKKVFQSEKALPVNLFERTTPVSTSFVSLTGPMQNIVPAYSYNDRDPLYATSSGYISDITQQPATTIAYRDLFSKRGQPLDKDMVTQLVPQHTGVVSPTSQQSIPCHTVDAGDDLFSTEQENNGVVRMMATNTKLCKSIVFDNINTSNVHIVEIASRAISGEPLRVSVTNKGRSVGLDIDLPKHTHLQTDYYLLPGTFPSEISYTLTVTNTSSNKYTSINDLGNVRLYVYPPSFVTQLIESTPLYNLPRQERPVEVSHVLSSIYSLKIPANTKKGDTVVLNQSYDKGWIAYAGKNSLPSHHVLVNNWANGWTIKEDSTDSTEIILFFWPQLLQWIGLIILPLPLVYGYIRRKRIANYHSEL